MQGDRPGDVDKMTASKIKKDVKLKKYIPAFILSALLFFAAVFSVYTLGYSNGARSRIVDNNSKSSESANMEASLSGIITNNWSVVGTVQDISEKSIRVKIIKGLCRRLS